MANTPNKPPAGQPGNQVTTGGQAQAGNVEGSIADILALIRDRIAQLNWLQFFQLIQQLIALFKGGGVQGATAKAAAQQFAGCPFSDCCKAHHDTINAVSDCWQVCCESHPDAGA